MGSATTDNEVALTKTISAASDRLRVDYRIDPPDGVAGRVHLVERFSESVGRASISFADQPDGQWEYRDEGEVAFVGEFDEAKPIETSLQVRSSTLTPEDCASTVTAVPPGGHVHRSSMDGERLATQDPGRFDLNGARRESETPAIGVVATDRNTEAIARTVIRATEVGLSVFVGVASEYGTAARIAEQLGAAVVQLDIADGDSVESATALLRAARRQSHPGLVFHGTCSGPIAIDASVERFRATRDPVVDAVVEPSQTTVLVGIPAYNEADTIRSVVEQASEHADEVLVVDDGSVDGTAERARETEATVVEHDRNGGYGAALKTIFAEADRRGVASLVVLDGDDQHDASDISRLVDEQRDSGADVVIGNRFGNSTEVDIPLYRRFGLFVITVLTNVSLGCLRKESRIVDTQSGFRCYSATAVETLAANRDAIDDGMSASVDILSVASREGLQMTEVPSTITYDVANASSQNPVTHGLGIVNRLLTTLERKRPLTTFGVPGVLLVLAGVTVGIAGAQSVTSGVASIGITLLATLLVLTGALSSVLSVVQHSLQTARNGGP